MAKGKSSASSGTRKKHARKAAGPEEPQPTLTKEKKPKGKDKKGKEPRKKVYIPVVKPAPPQPDPLDALGLASKLPPELLVVLRRFGKKDAVTKTRALEDLQAAWVERARHEKGEGEATAVLVEALPVWLHHFPALSLHPSRRIRILTTGLHASLLRIYPLREQIFFFVREVSSKDQAESILGAWCMAAYDMDRLVTSSARRTWADAVARPSAILPKDRLVIDDVLEPSMLAFVERAVLDPASVYAYLNPPAPVAALPPPRKGAKPSPRIASKKEDEEAGSRSRTAEDEEKQEDRDARIRIGALGALTWIIESHADSAPEDASKALGSLAELLANPALWTALYPLQVPASAELAGIESFGFDQPGVRRAGWAVLNSLVHHWQKRLEALMPVLSVAVLRSAWVEPDELVRGAMWVPLLTLLRAFPRTWEIEATSLGKAKLDDGEEPADSGDEESEEEEGTTEPRTKSPVVARTDPKHIPAYREFLRFLELGCSGSPIQGYPAVIVILSTIPPSVIHAVANASPVSEYFESMWAALDGRALSSLDRQAAQAAFLGSLLDSLLFFAKRLASPEYRFALFGQEAADGQTGASSEMVRAQFARVWTEASEGRLKVDIKILGKLMANALIGLYHTDEELFRSAWDPNVSALKARALSSDTSSSESVCALLKYFSATFQDGTRPKDVTIQLIMKISESAMEEAETSLRTAPERVHDALSSLRAILNAFNEILFASPGFSERVHSLVLSDPYRLYRAAPELFLSYLSWSRSEGNALGAWRRMLTGVASDLELAESILQPALTAAEQGILPSWMRPVDELDLAFGKLLASVLGGSGVSLNLQLSRLILEKHDYFLSPRCFHGVAETLVASFNAQVDLSTTSEIGSISSFRNILVLVDTILDVTDADLRPVWINILPGAFLLGHLLHRGRATDDSTSLRLSQKIWRAAFPSLSGDLQGQVKVVIQQRLQAILLDPATLPTPDDVMHTLSEDWSDFDNSDLLAEVFPPRAEIDAMLDALPSDPSDPSLAVQDLLVPPETSFADTHPPAPTYDLSGFSSYGRLITVLLDVLLRDRQTAKSHLWLSRHLLAFAIYGEDWQQVPTAVNPVFSPEVSKSVVADLVNKAHHVVAYLLAEPTESAWHKQVTASIMNGKLAASLDDPATFLVDLVNTAKTRDSVREARILYLVLRRIFASATREDADLWVGVARSVEKTAPETSMAIVLAVTQACPEPPRLDRYRNELAAAMLGVRPQKANSEGLLILRKLAVSAPDPESDVVFLPQLRAVNLMKACHQWITSDEDIDEEVESAMTIVFLALVPILQGVPGSHWDLIFDIMESNLENSSFTDDSTLVMLARTLKLIIAIQDLCATNKTLRALWQERQLAILTAVRDLTSVPLANSSTSGPRSACRELALTIVQDLPPSLIDENTLPSMIHLLSDTSVEVQRMAYQLLHEAAQKRTEFVVLEAGVDTEGTYRATLPLELVAALDRQIDAGEQNFQVVFGYLLGWMLAFDLFTEASMKVKSGYSEHLQRLNVISSRLLPTVYSLLDVDLGAKKAFRLDMWSVDEYYIQYFDGDVPLSLHLLGAHVYYRALLVVPSLVRAWLDACKDVQLSTAISGYTSRHFSPVIISNELGQVKDPAAMAELNDEKLAIRVSSTTNEVTAAYTVDEQQLEISLKIPPDWPLHGIQIRDRKNIGVSEDRWRAWVLGVQRIMWDQNGTIVDGLTLFKKNVSGHFEGLVECAICYSIIGLSDGSLPRKPCRTCKNRFHAACLYKWFESSHSSSCPLCRSEIF